MNQNISVQDLELITGKFRIKQKQIAEKEIMQMNIRCDYDGFIYFNELLYYFFKNSLYQSVFGRTEQARTQIEFEKCIKAEEILFKEEKITSKKLRVIKKKQATLTKQKFISSRQKDVNPMVRRLFVGMCFRSWLKYSLNIQKTIHDDYDDISSQTDSEDEQEEFNPNELQNTLAIDKFFNIKDDENIIQVRNSNSRKLIIPREHTMYQRKLHEMKRNSQDIPFFNGKYVQIPNAEDVYKQDFADDDYNQFQEKIQQQQIEERILQKSRKTTLIFNNQPLNSSVHSSVSNSRQLIHTNTTPKNNQSNLNNSLKLSHVFKSQSKHTDSGENTNTNKNTINNNQKIDFLQVRLPNVTNQRDPNDPLNKNRPSIIELPTSPRLQIPQNSESNPKVDSHNSYTPTSQRNKNYSMQENQRNRIFSNDHNSNSPQLRVPSHDNHGEDNKSHFSITPSNKLHHNDKNNPMLQSKHLSQLQATPITFTQHINSKNFLSSVEQSYQNEDDESHQKFGSSISSFQRNSKFEQSPTNKSNKSDQQNSPKSIESNFTPSNRLIQQTQQDMQLQSQNTPSPKNKNESENNNQDLMNRNRNAYNRSSIPKININFQNTNE